ncbi:hypothetical protein Lal_00014997 [Lupinus albus]|nr:hypothetical protein Lal_00014997 [Lupinus albus]
MRQQHDQNSYSRLSPHRRATRAEIRAGTPLARRHRRGGIGNRGGRAARAPLGRAARGRAGPRQRGRLRPVRPGGGPLAAVRLRTRALRFHGRGDAAAAPVHAGARRGVGSARRLRLWPGNARQAGTGDDEVVRHELSLPRAGIRRGHALRPRARAPAGAGRAGARAGPRRQGDARRPADVPVARQGQGWRRPPRAARVSAARVLRPAGPAEGGGRRMGAAGRTDPRPRPAGRLDARVRARLPPAARRRRPGAACDVLRTAAGKPEPRVQAARRRAARGRRARAGRIAARRGLAGGTQGAVGRHRRRPQHLARGPGRLPSAPAARARAARRSGMDRTVLLPAARAVHARARRGPRRRTAHLARRRPRKAGRTAHPETGARRRRSRRRTGAGRRPRRAGVPPCEPARGAPGRRRRAGRAAAGCRPPRVPVRAAPGRAVRPPQPARISHDDDRLVPTDAGHPRRARGLAPRRPGGRRLRHRDARRDRPRRPRAGKPRAGRPRTRRGRTQRHGRILRRTTGRLRVQRRRLGAVVRFALRETARAVRRRGPPRADDGGVDGLRAKPHGAPAERHADGARDHPAMVVRARRPAARRHLRPGRARDPRRGRGPGTGRHRHRADRRTGTARRLAAASRGAGRVPGLGGTRVPHRGVRRRGHDADPHAHVLRRVQRHPARHRRPRRGRDHDRDEPLGHGTAGRLRRVRVPERDRPRRLRHPFAARARRVRHGAPAAQGGRRRAGRAAVGEPGLRPQDARVAGDGGGTAQHGGGGAAAARRGGRSAARRRVAGPLPAPVAPAQAGTRLPGPDVPFAEIRLQRVALRRPVDQRDVRVRPDQVGGVAHQAGRLARVAPVVAVQRDAASGAPRFQRRPHLAVHVHLPRDGGQRGVVVRAAVARPRQPVAAAHVARAARGQGAVGIMDAGLRQHAEQERPHRFDAVRGRREQRRDAGAHEVGEAALRDREREHAVRRLDQLAGERPAFRLVGVDQRVGRAAAQHVRQFPCQVDGVADARVHALAAGGTVDVGGVAQQQHAPRTVVARHAVVHAVGREPAHRLDLQAEARDGALAHIVER